MTHRNIVHRQPSMMAHSDAGIRAVRRSTEARFFLHHQLVEFRLDDLVISSLNSVKKEQHCQDGAREREVEVDASIRRPANTRSQQGAKECHSEEQSYPWLRKHSYFHGTLAVCDQAALNCRFTLPGGCLQWSLSVDPSGRLRRGRKLIALPASTAGKT